MKDKEIKQTVTIKSWNNMKQGLFDDYQHG